MHMFSRKIFLLSCVVGRGDTELQGQVLGVGEYYTVHI